MNIRSYKYDYVRVIERKKFKFEGQFFKAVDNLGHYVNSGTSLLYDDGKTNMGIKGDFIEINYPLKNETPDYYIGQYSHPTEIPKEVINYIKEKHKNYRCAYAVAHVMGGSNYVELFIVPKKKGEKIFENKYIIPNKKRMEKFIKTHSTIKTNCNRVKNNRSHNWDHEFIFDDNKLKEGENNGNFIIIQEFGNKKLPKKISKKLENEIKKYKGYEIRLIEWNSARNQNWDSLIFKTGGVVDVTLERK